MPLPMPRGEFVRHAGLSALGLLTPYVLVPPRKLIQLLNRTLAPEAIFNYSIASGDPTSSGVILWTRINESVWNMNDPLEFQVATDEAFTNIVVQGLINGSDIGPDQDYTVKVDLDGTLGANVRYYYRFIYQNTSSHIGRCRTLPAPSSQPEAVKFGIVTCQDYTNGYYGAFVHLAQEDVDFVLHLGDFIYESSADPRFQELPYPDREIILPSEGTVALNLEDYRFLYKKYRSDPFFQLALEQHTFIIIWDDHEFANDCYWDYANDAPGAPDHPFNGNPDQLTQLRLESMQAWLEYVPARIQTNPNATHPHDFYHIYRNFKFGDLVELFMTDERLYRSPHPCGEDDFGQRYASPGCPEQRSPDRTMLGTEAGFQQRDWLINGLRNSTRIWKAWGNEVLQMPLVIPQPAQDGQYIFLDMDAWDGYHYERTYIMGNLRNQIKNLILLTGDLHTYMAGYVKYNYLRKNNSQPTNNLMGVEFMTPAVTSANLMELLPDWWPFPIDESIVKPLNWHVEFFNSNDWGYSTVVFTRNDCVYTAYSIDKGVNSGDVPKMLLRRLLVPLNNVKIIDITEASE